MPENATIDGHEANSHDTTDRSPYDEVVPDDDTCDRCDRRIWTDGDGEYRHRYILNDQARSHFGDRFGKLCAGCWEAVVQFIEDGPAGVDDG